MPDASDPVEREEIAPSEPVNDSIGEFVSRYDRGTLAKARVDDQTGFLRAPASITRTGVFVYVDGQGNTRRELRHPDDVLASDSLATLRSAVLTHHHPAAGAVTAFNAKGLQVGHTDSSDPEIDGDGEIKRIRTGITITDATAIAAVIKGDAAEVSAGYRTRVIPESGTYNGERYDARQTEIRYNHVALVPKGRAGSTVRVHLDSADAVEHYDSPAPPAAVMEPHPGDIMQINIGDGKASVSLGGTTYGGVHEGLAQAISALKADADTQRARADQAEANLAKVADEPKTDTAEIHRLAMERAGLLDRVAKVVKADATEADALAGMTAAEIRAWAVCKACPEVKADESEDYMRARFDALPEAQPEPAGTAGPALLAGSFGSRSDDDTTALEAKIHALQGYGAA